MEDGPIFCGRFRISELYDIHQSPVHVCLKYQCNDNYQKKHKSSYVLKRKPVERLQFRIALCELTRSTIICHFLKNSRCHSGAHNFMSNHITMQFERQAISFNKLPLFIEELAVLDFSSKGD